MFTLPIKMILFCRFYDHNLVLFTLYDSCSMCFFAKIWFVNTSTRILKYESRVIKNYGLCPSQYLSGSALIWDTILNITKVELELISDADMYLFFEKGVRGGVLYISRRDCQVNSRYLNSYDSK